MGRIINALKADVLFQFKQGFYFIYIVISVFYLIVLSQLSPSVIKHILPILLYIDPSILGLFFIGGILLLEKEQGLLSLLYVTPLKISEFMISKLTSLCMISIVITFSISLLSYSGHVNYLLLLLGITLTSLIYTLFGFTIASRSKSVNDFFVKMIPMMILFIIPIILMFIFPDILLLSLFPSVATFKLVWGAYHGMGLFETTYLLIYSLFITILFFNYAYKKFRNSMVVTD